MLFRSITTGSIQTAAPTGSSAQAWKLGSINTGIGLTLVTTQYITVEVNGTTYKLAVVN